MASPTRCYDLELASARLAAAPPDGPVLIAAMVAAGQLLQHHAGWRMPEYVTRASLSAMVGAERRWHGVVVQGCDLQ